MHGLSLMLLLIAKAIIYFCPKASLSVHYVPLAARWPSAQPSNTTPTSLGWAAKSKDTDSRFCPSSLQVIFVKFIFFTGTRHSVFDTLSSSEDCFLNYRFMNKSVVFQCMLHCQYAASVNTHQTLMFREEEPGTYLSEIRVKLLNLSVQYI